MHEVNDLPEELVAACACSGRCHGRRNAFIRLCRRSFIFHRSYLYK